MTTLEKPETLHIANLDQFVQVLTAWHEHKVKILEKLLEIPEGVEVTFNDKAPLVMNKDIHAGFQIGISLALIELGNLPFAAEVDEEVVPATDEPVQA